MVPVECVHPAMVIDGVTDLNASGTVGPSIPMVIDGINRLQCKWNVLAQLYLRSLMASIDHSAS